MWRSRARLGLCAIVAALATALPAGTRGRMSDWLPIPLVVTGLVLAAATAGRKPDPPDEIYLVSTFLPELWRVTCLRRFGRYYDDDRERFLPFDPADLTQLTKR